jgi:hypothetical protein
MGIITEAVKRYVPATYNAMLIAPSDNRLFATSDLQALADYVKYRLFSTSIPESQETSVFNPYEAQFLGKLTTLQFIPAAVDYWDSQLSSIVATGTGEVANFRDHRDGLLKLWEILSREVLKDAALLGFTLKKIGLIPAVTYGDNGRKILITPDPQCFPAPFKVTQNWISALPWKTVP